MIKLYILPIEIYEESLKTDFNLFRRDTFLYQYEDNIFMFYSWDKHVVYFNDKIKGFSQHISDYDLEGNFSPIFSTTHLSHLKTIRQYIANGVEVRAKIFAPPNEFIADSLVYLCSRIGIQEVEFCEIERYMPLSKYFFRDIKGDMRYTDIYPALYYQYFLTYLDHIIRLVYMRTSLKYSVTTFSLLFSKYFNSFNGYTKNAVKIRYIDSKEVSVAHKLQDPYFVQHEDGVYYPCKSWKNRVIPEIYDDNSVFQFDEQYYIQDDLLDFNAIMQREYCDLTTNELYIRFEHVLPQPMISYHIALMDKFVNQENIIELYPDFDFVPDSFETMLLNVKNEILMQDSTKDIFDSMRMGIHKIIGQLKLNIQDYVKILGVCPACEKPGIIKGHKGFFCIQCDGFSLWNATMEKKLGHVMSKNQMVRLLRPNSQYVTKIKNTNVRLYSRENRTNNNIRFWELEVR